MRAAVASSRKQSVTRASPPAAPQGVVLAFVGVLALRLAFGAVWGTAAATHLACLVDVGLPPDRLPVACGSVVALGYSGALACLWVIGWLRRYRGYELLQFVMVALLAYVISVKLFRLFLELAFFLVAV